jgi:hypothetical protein
VSEELNLAQTVTKALGLVPGQETVVDLHGDPNVENFYIGTFKQLIVADAWGIVAVQLDIMQSEGMVTFTFPWGAIAAISPFVPHVCNHDQED